MKALTFISGGLTFSLLTLGILFKFQYWPFANILLALSLLTAAIIFIPSLTKYWYDKN
ncbi:MAG: hypothetical protein PHQ74_02335 [Crocinitomicaceae bacterium]|nr:hypothetical protein [Crocinitomicaceae bacterium]